MTLIIIFFVLHSLALCYLAYTSNILRVIKGVLLTFLVLTGALAFDYYKDRLGAPIEGYPPEFIYVHHRIIGDNIELWVDFEDGDSRVYIFPYSQEAAEELQEAQEQTEQGNPQEGKFEPPEGNTDSPPAPVMDDWKGDNTEVTK